MMIDLIDRLQLTPRKLKIVAGVFGLFALTIILFAIISKIKIERRSDYIVSIENFSATTEIPYIYQDYIEDSIQTILVRENEQNIYSLQSAKIRDGSYKESKDGNLNQSSFIVDIEQLRYSFKIDMKWKATQKELNDPNIVISCPHYKDVIYTDKVCIAETPEVQLERYLPHYGRVGETKYAVNFQKYVDSSYLRVEIAACDDPKLIDEAIKDTKKWLKSLYLDPNDFNIGSVNTCRK